MSGTQTSLQFVLVRDPGNLPDPNTGNLYGSVGYNYAIGKYDVTLAQYCQFLNAVAATDTYGLYNAYNGGFFGKATFGISQSGGPGSLTYAVTGTAPGKENFPVPYVTWGDAARFSNWLDNGQGTATSVAAAYALTEGGAYQLSGATSQAALMAVASPAHTGAGAPQYFLPTENEWYKAAYYKSGGTAAGYWTYPTRSNTAPINTLPDTGNHANFSDFDHTGNGGYTDPVNYLTPVGSFSFSPGPYGSFDQGGDLWQWNETMVIAGSTRGLRGGSFLDVSGSMYSYNRLGGGYPTTEYETVGFRVANSVAVPEPGSIAIIVAAVCLLWWRGRRGAW